MESQHSLNETTFRLFEKVPGLHVTIANERPGYRVLSVSDDLVMLTGHSRVELVGISFIDLISTIGSDPYGTAKDNFNLSFELVASQRREHELPALRIDIHSNNSGSTANYWHIKNRPIVN